MQSQHLRNFILYPTFTLLFFGTAVFSMYLVVNDRQLIIWFPSGFALAILVMFGLRYWLCITLGVFAAALVYKLPIGAAAWMALGITLTSMLISYLLARVSFRYTLERLKDLFYLLIGVLFYSAIGSSIALLGQRLGGVIPSAALGNRWLIMWAGDIVSLMVVAPVLFIWRAPFRYDIRKSGWKLFEAGLLLVTLILFTLQFLNKPIDDIDDFYIFFPLLIWAGLRFGKRGATITVFLVVLSIIIIDTIQFPAGMHRFVDLLLLEVSAITTIVITLLLSVVITERMQAEVKLKELNDYLEQRVIERTQALSMEIVERVRYEAALVESEEKYRNIIENSVDGIILIDSEGYIREWNRGLENIFGLKKAEVIGEKLCDVIYKITPDEKKTPDLYESNQNYFSQLFAGEVSLPHQAMKVRIQRPDGVRRTIQSIMFMIESRQKLLLSSIIRDVTEQETLAEATFTYVQRLKVLHEIDHQILDSKSLEQKLETVLPGLRNVMKSQWAGIIIFDDYNKLVRILEIDREKKLKWRTELCNNFNDFQMPPKLKQGEMFLAADLQTAPELTPLEKKLLNEGIHTHLSIPLFIQGTFIGAISFGAGESRAFNFEHLEIAWEVANEIAISILQSRLIGQVQAGREELRQLAQRVVTAQEEERHRLSRELHDEAGQALTALKISLELITGELTPEQANLDNRLKEAINLTDATMEQLGMLAKRLRPSALDTVGLNFTLEDLCREFARRTNIAVDYRGENLPVLPNEYNICLYRILQESLTNVCKHAKADRVLVELRQETNKICLKIKDNGGGFRQPDKQHQGIGLLGMKERLMTLGGKLEIKSQLGQGTQLSALIPWRGLERFDPVKE